MRPSAATCGKSDVARIGTWEQVRHFLHGLVWFGISLPQFSSDLLQIFIEYSLIYSTWCCVEFSQ